MVFSSVCGISRRWEFMFLLCSGVIIVYTLRVNMSVAASKMKEEFGWSEVEKGFVLSSFYWGYTVGQIPASWIAKKYGAKLLFGLSVLIPSILTMLVPVACRSSYGLALVIRCLIGLLESSSFPAIFYFFPLWIPAHEKTVMVSTVFSGMYLGEILGFSLSGYLVDSHVMSNGTDIGGWPSVFYVFGLAGVIWYPFWMYMAYETPETHPHMSSEELALIRGDSSNAPLLHKTRSDKDFLLNDDSSAVVVANAVAPISNDEAPWRLFFTTPASLTLLLASFTNGWIGFTLLSEMPSYLSDELGFNLSTAGLLCVVPYAALFVTTMTSGELFKYLQIHKGWSTHTVRQLAQFICFGGAATALIAGSFFKEKYAGFGFMILAQAFLGFNQSGLGCAYLDLAPRFSGLFTTVGNTLGALAGTLGPILIAVFVDRWEGMAGWRDAFYLTGAISFSSLVMWYFFQQSELMPALNNPVQRKHDHFAGVM